MSTIKVTNVNPPTAGDAVNINGLAYPTAGPLSNRNLIINGAMQVAQRGTSTTGVGTAIAYNTVDRWRFADASDPSARYTQTQSTDAPDGFSYSHKFEVTTADTNVEADETQYTDYFIEAQDLQHLAYGTSAAKKIILSFWVKSSVAQTFGVGLAHEDGGGNYGVSYTVNSADTWEYKTLTFNGNTSTAINNDNGRGIRISFALASGSDNADGSDATDWEASGTSFGEHSNTWLGTVGNTWQITGVQLEVGEVATPFEHRSYGDELRRCQRYYQVVVEGEAAYTSVGTAIYYQSNSVRCVIPFMTAMRANPSVEIAASGTDTYLIYRNGAVDYASPPSASFESKYSVEVNFSTGVSGTAGQVGFIRADQDSSCKIAAEAEL